MKDEFRNYYVRIGINLRKARVKKNWTQDELANRCSVNSAKISKIENAREDYMFSTLIELCKALDIDVSYLLNKQEPGEN
ncbi:helix-turn-helix transcriptional regulator (plasmid) [Pedobacter sp. BS3]|uniref:helix-turn-helix domain-containing protein n=1 Tax=Pedobacter sp. BS3 TaxID=2567937 RepID=UPI0011EC628D|nr:helix-turn-helix transcriptional regulator [Pedobacter sp. BS3]TZF86162.1 helix-turn-helix transcriptional regulator [Pedobacter sp. BS3]